MQFKITLKVLEAGKIPASYQYPLSSWIYSLIGKSNSEFATFLHDKAYIKEGKSFKFFTFSKLFAPHSFWEIKGDRMNIWSKTVHFHISFLVEEAARWLVMGVFEHGRVFELGDKLSRMKFEIQSVEMQMLPEIKNTTIRCSAISPILVAQPISIEGKGLQHKYLRPTDDNYSYYFFENLKEKYETALLHNLIAPTHPLSIEPKFRLLSDKVKQFGIKIKSFTPAETKIIGYEYDFEVTNIPITWIKVGLMGGFGGENSQGMGMGKVLEYK